MSYPILVKVFAPIKEKPIEIPAATNEDIAFARYCRDTGTKPTKEARAEFELLSRGLNQMISNQSRKVSVDNDPNIKIKTESQVFKVTDGYRWKINIHIVGPDDVIESESKYLFQDQRSAYADMFAQHGIKTDEILKKYEA